MPSIQDLPGDVLRIIAIHLDFDSFQNYTSIAKRFRSIFEDGKVWKSRLQREFPNALPGMSPNFEGINDKCFPYMYLNALTKDRLAKYTKTTRKKFSDARTEEIDELIDDLEDQIESLRDQKRKYQEAYTLRMKQPYLRISALKEKMIVPWNYLEYPIDTNMFERIKSTLKQGYVFPRKLDNPKRADIRKWLDQRKILREWPVETLIRLRGPVGSLFIYFHINDDDFIFSWPNLPIAVRRKIWTKKWDAQKVSEVFGFPFTTEDINPDPDLSVSDSDSDEAGRSRPIGLKRCRSRVRGCSEYSDSPVPKRRP